MANSIDLPEMDPDDIPGYLHDEIQAFAKHHNITVDRLGFVHGGMLPTDVLSLGYLLISWVVLGNSIKEKE